MSKRTRLRVPADDAAGSEAVSGARAAIEKDKRDRVERSRTKITQVLAEERTRIEVRMVLSANGIHPIVEILPSD